MSRQPVALCLALAMGAAPAAFAQAPAPPGPAAPARMQAGPFSLRPTVILRDVGFDSNVFNQADDPETDFTATMGAKLDVGMRLPRLQGTYSTAYEYVYFKTLDSERGSNRNASARIDALLGRLRPYVAGGIADSHERPTAEIDARARRRQSQLETGVAAAVFSRTGVRVSYARTAVEYGADELFRGVRLRDELNGSGEAITAAADVELTPLTTFSLSAERSEDRFEVSPERDARSYRLVATATLHPLALISGRASVGLRAFRPHGEHLPEFTGLTAALELAYSPREDTRLSVMLDRDLRYSFERLTPYYISTGGRVTLTQQLVGRLDTQVFGGAERLAYEARLDAAVAADTDRVRSFGGGIGYRLGDGARVAVNGDHTRRSSPFSARGYSRARIYTTLSYGF